jgi:hypothetical protein
MGRWWAGPLIRRLVGHQPVALHDVARHLGVARPGGVGDDEPAMRLGVTRAGADRIVIGSGHAPDLGTERGDRCLPARADGLVEGDDAAAVEPGGGPGEGAAMVAVGGGGDGDAARGLGVAAAGQIGRARGCRDISSRQLPGEQVGDRVRATQRLETAETETAGFVLEPDRSGQRQIEQRGRCVTVPTRDLCLRAAKSGGGQGHEARGAVARVHDQGECGHRLTVTPRRARCKLLHGRREPGTKPA